METGDFLLLLSIGAALAAAIFFASRSDEEHRAKTKAAEGGPRRDRTTRVTKSLSMGDRFRFGLGFSFAALLFSALGTLLLLAVFAGIAASR